MAKQRAKGPKRGADLRMERAQQRIGEAYWGLRKTWLGPLLCQLEVHSRSMPALAPSIACAAPNSGEIWLNAGGPDLSAQEWAHVIAHEALHIGFRHDLARERRDPLVWNLACDSVIDHLLATMKIGTPPAGCAPDPELQGVSETALYDRFLDGLPYPVGERTLAGSGRTDIVAGTPTRYRASVDYAALLAQGLREAVDDAIWGAAEAMGEALPEKTWRPGEEARRWVLNHIPLLGSLCTELRIVADENVCYRLGVSIAAVNPFLGEIYINPRWSAEPEELRFVYVHELLHVALMHHARAAGRDPYLWNVACDFVINGWLVEMGVGKMPSVGVLYDPALAGESSERVYDLVYQMAKKHRKPLCPFGMPGGDVLRERDPNRVCRGLEDLDDLYRRHMQTGLARAGRGLLPAGLLEEVRSLFTPPVPWDVELARWMDSNVAIPREKLRTYARASRRQSSTPDIPRPARYLPQEWRDACTFGVVLDTSGSMDRELLGRALGAIASYAEAREVPVVRLVLCDAKPYDRGLVEPGDLRGVFAVTGRGGTVLQPAIDHLLRLPDFPPRAPVMILTDGYCEEEIRVPREHCFVLPCAREDRDRPYLRTNAPVFRVLREPAEE